MNKSIMMFYLIFYFTALIYNVLGLILSYQAITAEVPMASNNFNHVSFLFRQMSTIFLRSLVDKSKFFDSMDEASSLNIFLFLTWNEVLNVVYTLHVIVVLNNFRLKKGIKTVRHYYVFSIIKENVRLLIIYSHFCISIRVFLTLKIQKVRDKFNKC